MKPVLERLQYCVILLSIVKSRRAFRNRAILQQQRAISKPRKFLERGKVNPSAFYGSFCFQGLNLTSIFPPPPDQNKIKLFVLGLSKNLYRG